MKVDSYTRVCLLQVPSSLEDEVAEFCQAAGCSGLAQSLEFFQDPEDYSVKTLDRETVDLDVFFTTPPDPRFLNELKTKFPQVLTQVHHEVTRDWLEEWKKGFNAFCLVEDVWVVPPWQTPPTHAAKWIWLEPGMAFGTGTHATTRLSSRLLHRMVSSRPGGTVLDVGTGSGILAILAVLSGAREAWAIDNDPEAMRVVRENLAFNRESRVVASDLSVSELIGEFDIVVANIIDGVLLQLEPELTRLVRPGGFLVLSGIIDERREHFLSRFQPEGFRWVIRERDEEWHGYVLEKS